MQFAKSTSYLSFKIYLINYVFVISLTMIILFSDQKIFIHELYITSFGFDSTKNRKDIYNWDDYIERLLATQSIRQLLLCLLQQWAVEFEYNIITIEEELSLRNPMENSKGYSALSTYNEDKQTSEHKIYFKTLLQKSTTQLSKGKFNT